MKYIVSSLIVIMLSGNFAMAQLTGQSFEKAKIEIISLIETETNAYFQQDLEKWSACFVNAPYMQRVGYWEGYPNKISQVVGWEDYQARKTKLWDNPNREKSEWDNSTFERSNYQFRIYEDMAWATFEEVSHSESGEFLGKALSTRILEKHDGQWKIAYIGFYYYPLTANSGE